MYKRIKGQFPDSNFPIFAYLCTKHRKVNKEKQNLDNYDNNDIDDPDVTPLWKALLLMK